MRYLKQLSILVMLALLCSLVPTTFAEPIDIEVEEEIAGVNDTAGEDEAPIEIDFAPDDTEVVVEVADAELFATNSEELDAFIESEPAIATDTSGQGIALTAANFPDASFRSYLEQRFDDDGDGYIPNDIDELYISNDMITNLKGIELFPELTDLSCYSNLLTSLDLSGNPKLQELDCSDNLITSLNLSNNAELSSLSCYGNQLSSLNVSKNVKLQYLSCGGNLLKSLDLSNNTKLKSLNCSGNQLTSLKVDGFSFLTWLNCSDNQLTSLSLTGDTLLRQLSCTDNNLTSLDLSNFNSAIQALFTDANTEMSEETMRLGNDNYYVECDNHIQLTMNGKVIRPLNATSISFSQEEVKLAIGSTLQLNPVIKPSNATTKLTYEYDDDYITVSKTGLVTALAEGYSTVYVETDNCREARIHIDVIPPAPTSIKLSKTSISIGYGDQITLPYSLSPKGAESEVAVTSSKSSVADAWVDYYEGIIYITAYKKGTTTLTFKTSNGKKATATVKVLDQPKKVTLNKKGTVKLALNETLQLKATLPKNTASVLTWSSSKTSVAKVSQDGKVTPVKAGSATITVKTSNGKKATVKVTVTAPVPTGVKLSAAKATLGVKQTLSLSAALTPSNAKTTLTWKSNKPSVAKVDKKGKVTAVKAGTAVITVKTANGKSAKATITVKPGPKKVTLDKTGTVTLAKGKTLQLKATLTAGSVTALTWTSSKSKVASVSQTGKVTAKAAGTTVITVKTSNGKSAKVTIKVK